jgi:GNAT superfamily N-acetyltransferase
MTTEELLEYCNDGDYWDGDEIQHKVIDDYKMICIPHKAILLEPSFQFHVVVNPKYRKQGLATKLVNSIPSYGYSRSFTTYEEDFVKSWLSKLGFEKYSSPPGLIKIY